MSKKATIYPALTHFSCMGNQLKSFDVSKNNALTELSCNGNQFDCVPIED
jgi:Leucine-rich repeat (LRR) protein